MLRSDATLTRPVEPPPPLATDNLLENTDGVLRPPPRSAVFSRGGTLLPSSYADARYIDAVIVSQALASFAIEQYTLYGERDDVREDDGTAPSPTVLNNLLYYMQLRESVGRSKTRSLSNR